MALVLDTVIAKYHLSLSDAYVIVGNIHIVDGIITFAVNTYTSEEARRSGAAPIDATSISIPVGALDVLEGSGIIAKLYAALKRRSEYNSGIDA